jgi:hypothetical protein
LGNGWTVVVIPDGVLPPLPGPLVLLAQPVRVQWRKDIDVMMK